MIPLEEHWAIMKIRRTELYKGISKHIMEMSYILKAHITHKCVTYDSPQLTFKEYERMARFPINIQKPIF